MASGVGVGLDRGMQNLSKLYGQYLSSQPDRELAIEKKKQIIFERNLALGDLYGNELGSGGGGLRPMSNRAQPGQLPGQQPGQLPGTAMPVGVAGSLRRGPPGGPGPGGPATGFRPNVTGGGIRTMPQQGYSEGDAQRAQALGRQRVEQKRARTFLLEGMNGFKQTMAAFTAQTRKIDATIQQIQRSLDFEGEGMLPTDKAMLLDQIKALGKDKLKLTGHFEDAKQSLLSIAQDDETGEVNQDLYDLIEHFMRQKTSAGERGLMRSDIEEGRVQLPRDRRGSNFGYNR